MINNLSHDNMWDTINQWLKQSQSRSSWWVFNIMGKIPNILANNRDLRKHEISVSFCQAASIKIIQTEWFQWYIFFFFFFPSPFKSLLPIQGIKCQSFNFKSISTFSRAFPGGQHIFKSWFFLHERKQSKKEKWLLQMRGASWIDDLHLLCYFWKC